MDIARIVKSIRERFGWSQMRLAAELDVSFATVNRWENARNTPTAKAIELLKRVCLQNGVEFSDFLGNTVMDGDTAMRLYCVDDENRSLKKRNPEQGYNSAIGFSMSTHKEYAMATAAKGAKEAYFAVSADLQGLRMLYFDHEWDFLLYEAAIKGLLDADRYPALYQKYKDYAKGCDLVVGFEENGILTEALERFIAEEITDVSLLKLASALALPRRYIAISAQCRRAIAVQEERKLTLAARVTALTEIEQAMEAQKALSRDVLRRHRRDGLYIDEMEAKERAEREKLLKS